MTSGRLGISDGNWGERVMDISELAREFRIDPGMLGPALDGAVGLLRVSRENIRPADKKALRGVAKALTKALERLSDEAVRERLVGAAVEEPDGPDKDDDGLAAYIAWWAARDRVAHALAGAQDLLTLVRAGEDFKVPPGRPRYDHWTIAIASLLEFWTDDLRREVTVSGHASDPRGVKPSRVVQFVHRCMQLLGEEITEQACRTVLERLRAEPAAGCRY